MKKFENLLFCADLDGTLLNDNREISKENLDAIEYFKSEGGKFTFITGRSPIIATDIYNKVKPNVPFGCFNGGGLYDGEKDELIWSVTLPKNAKEIVDFADKHFQKVGIQINTQKTIYYQKESDATKWFRAITNTPYICGDFDTIMEPIIKVVFACNDEKYMDKFSQELLNHPSASQFDFIRSEFTLFEILPKNVSKGNVLKILADYLKIDMKNTVAIGDYNNDISMIKAAGVGVAVSNAVPDAKAVADIITVSNNEHAIAKVIDDIDKGFIKFG
ncbi:MAG: HAD family phosphatase [Clostridia bacterium]|nr:HAD family phosphatase [Clostridia bacterium]